MNDFVLLNDRSRLKIEVDPHPTTPRIANECVTGVYTSMGTMPSASIPPALYRFPGDLPRAISHMWREEADEPEESVIRWAHTFFNLALVNDGRNWWYIDRLMWDRLIGGPATIADQTSIIMREQAEWFRFANKHARVVSLERRVEYKRIDESHTKMPELFHVWETIESVSDVYLIDYDDNVGNVAKAHFGGVMKTKERATIEAMLDEESMLSKEGANA
jgi:hypothetical protein